MQTATQNKSFLLIGSYRTHLPIKDMMKEAKASNKRMQAIKRKNAIERKKILLRCAIITEKDLVPAGVC
jgi:hypothetical protein